MSVDFPVRRHAIVDFLSRNAPRVQSVKNVCAHLKAIHMLNDRDTKDPYRAVKLDLQKLERTNGRIHSTKGKPKGWYIEREASALPTMTPAMALWIVHSDEQSATLPSSVREHIRPLAADARKVLAGSHLSNWRELAITVPHGPMLVPPTIAEGVMDAILLALGERRRLELVYTTANEDKPPQTHIADALGLVTVSPKTYLVARFRGLVRPVPLQRIVSARVLDEPAREAPAFRLREWVERGGLARPLARDLIRLELVIPNDLRVPFREFRLSEDQELSPSSEAGHTRVTATVKDTHQLRNHLWSFGGLVRVEAPANVRQDFAAVVAAMHAAYSTDKAKRSTAARVAHARARAAGVRVGRPASVDVDLVRVRELRSAGRSLRAIARDLNVSVGAVQRAVAHKGDHAH